MPPTTLSDQLIESATAAAQQLTRQEDLSVAVVNAAECLLRNPDWQGEVADVLRRLGQAAGASRVQVFENHSDEQGRQLSSQMFEWAAPGVEPQIHSPLLTDFSLRDAGLARWERILSAGEALHGVVAQLPPLERPLLEALGAKSVALVPIMVDERWWGFLGFVDCDVQRAWEPSSLAVLRTAADLLGAALSRRDADEYRLRLADEVAAHAAAEAATARAAFLADATKVLISSLDSHTTLARFAHLAVPFLGDYCLIDVLDEGELRRVATSHRDPAKLPVIRELERFPPRSESNPILRALRGRRSIMATPADLTPEAISPDPAHQAIVRQLCPKHGLFVPIRTGRDVIGVMTVCSCRAERAYGKEDLAFAEDLAQRAGMAVGNAQLFQAAQQAKRMRDEVLSVVAHDLRNPLGAVLGAAEILQTTSADDAVLRLAEMIRRSAQAMNRLIQDLLEASRLERGALSLNPAPVAVDELLGEATAMLESLAQARGIDLRRTSTCEDTLVTVDSGRILQVLSNLIGNAIKFTPHGGTVEVRARPEDDWVAVEVEDTGPGIDPEEVARLFDRYWQGNSADRRGLGLGLSIARGLVEAHGGRLSADSRPGLGTTFRFTLPATASLR